MRHNDDGQTKRTPRVRRLFVATFALGCAFGTVTHAQNVTPPVTSTRITPDPGNSAFLVGHAHGTQGYLCLPTSPGAAIASWTVTPPRPEATLFASRGQDFQIITHFFSPDTNPNDIGPKPVPFGNATWQSSSDSSKVWAAVLHSNSVNAGPSEPGCPNTGAIPCLLLEAVGAEEGPAGGKMLTKTTFVQRLNTNGGSAPDSGCFTAADVGNQALVPYTADYYFYSKDKKDK
jgi:hypothetical protein